MRQKVVSAIRGGVRFDAIVGTLRRLLGPANRRKCPRLATGGVPVRLWAGGAEPFAGRLLDLSRGGALLRVPWPLRAGDEVDLDVPAPEPRRPDEVARIRAQVVRLRPERDGRSLVGVSWKEPTGDLDAVMIGWAAALR